MLCSFLSYTRDREYVHGLTRLVAVNADGSEMKVLVQNSDAAQGESQDRILNWDPGLKDTVLVEADEGLDATGEHSGENAAHLGRVGSYGAPAVFELNIRTGKMKLRQRSHPPVRSWITDPQGNVRIGFSISGTVEGYFARRAGESELRRLSKFEAFTRERVFEPIAVTAEDPDKVYALSSAEGRTALWVMDLRESSDPELVYAHPAVSVSNPVLARDGRLLGVHYETERPNISYVDDWTRNVMRGVAKAMPNTFNSVHGVSRDNKVFVIASRSDIAPTTFSVFDANTGRLTQIAETAANLPASAMSRMTPIWYPARDGVEVPGYLSLPPGGAKTNLPLIVLPHGGPMSRDTWGWFFLRQFLTSRGYAVLQMNFRGSTGYGDDWLFAAHQDWGGLTYDDVVDGTRWAITKGIADPKRVCVVGWSFGGYIAMVGAQRNPDLFRCAASIAGVSDLTMLTNDFDRRYFFDKIAKRQIGTDRAKLKLDSPRLHAADIGVPLLLVHGTLDPNVLVEQSEAMDKALAQAQKPHRFVAIPDGDHSLMQTSQRVTLLKELEAFLAANMGAESPPPH
jgi:dipeptidyl aminopeptidase/acylaminoacyl peptidase